MSTERDVNGIVRSWLDDGVTVLPDRVLDAVLAQIPATPQRRAPWLARRFPEMNKFNRFATAAVAVVAIVIVGVVLAKATNIGGPSPTAVPTPTPPLLNTLPTGDLAAGIYQIDAVFPVPLRLTLPTGFGHGTGAAADVGIHFNGSGAAHGIEFQIPSNVYADPCHRTPGPASPATGPSVDDLVTAMTTMVGFQSGPVTDLTIGGFPAKAFDLTNQIDPATCDGQDIRAFVFLGGGESSIGSGQRERIYVMKVGDQRLMIMTYYFPNGVPAMEADAAARLKKIVQSIEIL